MHVGGFTAAGQLPPDLGAYSTNRIKVSLDTRTCRVTAAAMSSEKGSEASLLRFSGPLRKQLWWALVCALVSVRLEGK